MLTDSCSHIITSLSIVLYSFGVLIISYNPDAIVSPLGKAEEVVSIYNLAGQRLSKLQKGINIVNGKKILVK